MSKKVYRPLTIRRMANGELVLLVDETLIDGVISVEAIDDGQYSFTKVTLANAALYFDTEKLDLEELN